MPAFERITFDPAIMGGRACVRGMRIPVSVIVGQLAHGASVEEILQGYPDLEREDVQQALAYAAWLAQEEVRASQRRAGMRFLADMGVDVRVVRWLNEHGHDAIHLRDENLHRLPNGEIFAKAAREARILLTLSSISARLPPSPPAVRSPLSSSDSTTRVPLMLLTNWRACYALPCRRFSDPRWYLSRSPGTESGICRSAKRSQEYDRGRRVPTGAHVLPDVAGCRGDGA